MKKDKNLFRALLFLLIFVGFFISIGTNSTKKKEIDTNFEEIDIPQSEIDYGNGTEYRTIDDRSIIASGVYEYNNFILNGELVVSPGSKKQSVIIRAKEKITISKNAKIILTGAGLEPYAGLDNEYAGSGASGIGRGGSGNCFYSNEIDYITAAIDQSVFFGQGAGNGQKVPGRGGNGGGFIALYAPEIVIDGKVWANGQGGAGSGGGGGAGKVVIIGERVTLNGLVSAQGGAGGSSQIQGAGGGGGGMIIISKFVGQGAINVSGGEGGDALDLYTGCGGSKGEPGKVYLANLN